jgi:hypothetical protein
MMPPGSPCLKAAAPFGSYKPERLGRAEIVGGLRIARPRTSSNSTVARVYYLPRFREVFGENQMRASL